VTPAVGVALGRLNPAFHLEVTLEAERLGLESVWLPEHLVFPLDLGGSPFPGEDHPPVPPTTPVFDCFAYLAWLAGQTKRLRLGSHVYLLGLRHPFVSARAIQTLDVVSGGRALAGVGAGWLASECRAAGVEFATRGRRLDEAMAVCRRLWTEATVAHEGAFFRFEAVAFEPKPVSKPHPPLLVGGESPAALRREARLGDGWLGLDHTPDSAAALVARLRALRAEAGRADEAFSITVGGRLDGPADLAAFARAGVDRVIVSPWRRSREAVHGLRQLAAWL
jgi:probable F420-dependent oxidoreductase